MLIDKVSDERIIATSIDVDLVSLLLILNIQNNILYMTKFFFSIWCSHFVPPENIRKCLVFLCFQGVFNGNIGQKWVNGVVSKNTQSQQERSFDRFQNFNLQCHCSHLVEISQFTFFKPLFHFSTPWNKKTSSFVMFSRVVEIGNGIKMGYFTMHDQFKVETISAGTISDFSKSYIL